jgi:hypothetical protein
MKFDESFQGVGISKYNGSVHIGLSFGEGLCVIKFVDGLGRDTELEDFIDFRPNQKAKDIINKIRNSVYNRSLDENGIFRSELFDEETEKEIWKEYNTIAFKIHLRKSKVLEHLPIDEVKKLALETLDEYYASEVIEG